MLGSFGWMDGWYEVRAIWRGRRRCDVIAMLGKYIHHYIQQAVVEA